MWILLNASLHIRFLIFSLFFLKTSHLSLTVHSFAQRQFKWALQYHQVCDFIILLYNTSHFLSFSCSEKIQINTLISSGYWFYHFPHSTHNLSLEFTVNITTNVHYCWDRCNNPLLSYQQKAKVYKYIIVSHTRPTKACNINTFCSCCCNTTNHLRCPLNLVSLLILATSCNKNVLPLLKCHDIIIVLLPFFWWRKWDEGGCVREQERERERKAQVTFWWCVMQYEWLWWHIGCLNWRSVCGESIKKKEILLLCLRSERDI